MRVFLTSVVAAIVIAGGGDAGSGPVVAASR
jgi:hypothetical protein